MYTKHRSGKLKFRMCAVLKHNNILLHRLCIALIEHTAKKKRISKHISCCTIIQISQLNSVQFQLVSTFLLCLLNAPIELRALSLVFVFSWYICFTQVLSARRRFPNSSMSEMAEKCGVAPRVPTEPHFSYVFVYFRRPLQSYRPRYSIPNRYERISKTAHRANEYTNGTNEHKKKSGKVIFCSHSHANREWVSFPRCEMQSTIQRHFASCQPENLCSTSFDFHIYTIYVWQ